ncbi:hypothetical protein A6R68_22660 [Neotoma lepida]|uniref:PH domain-containing protein n=1 Tax=Neotoma lepida TaxID=56216 RepID=A0A1A6HYQ8_NEOLE|nr:hypothetical protein A6R68_22660 [Neotoma lepida]
MSGGIDNMVCTSWLRKSPPKMLRRYLWKKHWFILWSSRMSGNPDVLEYYKNEHSKKPLRIINLSFCEQVDTGLTFHKKELQDSFMFDIKTKNITNTDLGDNEDSLAPKKSTGKVNYIGLDFQLGSPSPHRKPSTSSVTSDEKVYYVQVDKEKTQALQTTVQEWTDMRWSSEPS